MQADNLLADGHVGEVVWVVLVHCGLKVLKGLDKRFLYFNVLLLIENKPVNDLRIGLYLAALLVQLLVCMVRLCLI